MSQAQQRELKALRREHGGHLTPAQLLAHAASPRSALHALFEWDDTVAAQRYREQQAARVLRVVARVVASATRETTVVARTVASQELPPRPTAFKPPLPPARTKAERAQQLQEALDDLRILRRRYGQLEELDVVWKAMERVSTSFIATRVQRVPNERRQYAVHA